MHYCTKNTVIASAAGYTQPKGVICIMGSKGNDPVAISLTNYIISYGSICIFSTRVHWQVEGANYILLTKDRKLNGGQ